MGHRITFVVNAFGGQASQKRSHDVLYGLLLALVHVDLCYLRENPQAPKIYASGVYYEEEPEGAEDWLDVPELLALGKGDCEDLACWRVAELMMQGEAAKPTFTWAKLPTGGNLYHIQVQRGDGRIEDPSRILGMR